MPFHQKYHARSYEKPICVTYDATIVALYNFFLKCHVRFGRKFPSISFLFICSFFFYVTAALLLITVHKVFGLTLFWFDVPGNDSVDAVTLVIFYIFHHKKNFPIGNDCIRTHSILAFSFT